MLFWVFFPKRSVLSGTLESWWQLCPASSREGCKVLRGLGVLVHPSFRNVEAAQRAWAVHRRWREPQAASGQVGEVWMAAGAAP